MTTGTVLAEHFNSQPREGGWKAAKHGDILLSAFQLTAARRRLAPELILPIRIKPISTHSRAKAAGLFQKIAQRFKTYFNSQPREGGWGVG